MVHSVREQSHLHVGVLGRAMVEAVEGLQDPRHLAPHNMHLSSPHFLELFGGLQVPGQPELRLRSKGECGTIA
eukprot:4366249-Alexandrium_andersonii.AAC.1